VSVCVCMCRVQKGKEAVWRYGCGLLVGLSLSAKLQWDCLWGTCLQHFHSLWAHGPQSSTVSSASTHKQLHTAAS
jgi:hypothetical protein